MVEQGDVVKVNGVELPLLVVSGNAYNKSGAAILCPIVKNASEATLKVFVENEQISGYALCDNIRHLDIAKRGYSGKGHIPLTKMILILDMIQSLFDYV